MRLLRRQRVDEIRLGCVRCIRIQQGRERHRADAESGLRKEVPPSDALQVFVWIVHSLRRPHSRVNVSSRFKSTLQSIVSAANSGTRTFLGAAAVLTTA